MVRKVNKIDKSNYKKESKSNYLIIGIVAVAIIAVVVYMGIGGSSSTTALAGPAPSGTNCPENIAYLQVGVDKYTEVKGQVPTELTQLLETTDKGESFVEKLVECPTGNLYVISDGRVIETSK